MKLSHDKGRIGKLSKKEKIVRNAMKRGKGKKRSTESYMTDKCTKAKRSAHKISYRTLHAQLIENRKVDSMYEIDRTHYDDEYNDMMHYYDMMYDLHCGDCRDEYDDYTSSSYVSNYGYDEYNEYNCNVHCGWGDNWWLR